MRTDFNNIGFDHFNFEILKMTRLLIHCNDRRSIHDFVDKR